MSKLFLPTGHYCFSVLAVGGEFVDGGMLELQFAQPLGVPYVPEAVRKGIDTLVPRTLAQLPAGGWWLIDLSHKPGCTEGRRLTYQSRNAHPLARADFRAVLSVLLPWAAAELGRSMLQLIGVEPIVYDHRPPRRELH